MRILILPAALLLLVPHAHADVKIKEETQKRIDKALEWLSSKQNTDGSFSEGPYQHNTAITAFAMLAFMSQGHLPNQGLYGPEVAKAGRFLIASAQKVEIAGASPEEKEGAYLIGARGGNMYAHAMATLALAELWGQTMDEDLRPVLKKAVNLIVNTQQRDRVDRDGKPMGGWRYEPRPTGADISVTIMQVMALRSARNGGIKVPDATFDKAIRYIKSCYHGGGFTYQSGSGAPGFARTAAGCCVLFLSGKYDKKDIAKDYGIDIEKAVDYMKKTSDSPIHFYYGHYYAAHAMHQVGGKDWDDWYDKMERFFGGQQQADGSWSRTTRSEVGPVYQTSIATIILSVPAGYLPIFQR
ncbi:MAG: prenyltransferase/squalene oxidase repeat-containing protein [Gemmataceae bacterium]